MPMMFEPWAVDRTWTRFATLAALVEALPVKEQHVLLKGNILPFWEGWETEYSEVHTQAAAFQGRILARRLVSALVLVQTLLGDMKREKRTGYKAVRFYLDKGRCEVGCEKALACGKRYVYDWLKQRAERA